MLVGVDVMRKIQDIFIRLDPRGFGEKVERINREE